MSHGEAKSAKNGNDVQAPSSREPSQGPTPPPDGGWGWMVVFASFMIHIVIDGMTYSFGIFYSEFLTYFEESKGKTAWIVSVLVGISLCSGPISSSFVNLWGCRAVTVAGAVLAAFFITVSAFATNVLTLIVTIGVGTGFGFGLIYLPAIVSVTVWFEKRRSLATGIAVCGSGLGTFLFAPITSALISEYGWQGALAIIGAFVLNCVPMGLIFLPVPEPRLTPVTEPMLPKHDKAPLQRSQSTEHVLRINGSTEDGDIARLTLSQPALNKPQEHKTSQPPSRHGSGIMQRPDVLYQGSMHSVAKFQRSASCDRDRAQTSKQDREVKCGWLPCSTECKAALAEMLDLSILADPIFILFAISNFLTSIGFYIPYVHTVALSEHMGVENSAYLISTIGGSNLLGRIVLGYISDKPWVNRLLIYNLCLTIAGISCAFFVACWEFWGLALCCTVFGFTIGAYVGLTSVVLVDLLGLERLTNAFGLLLLFQGIASLIGPPFAGWLFDTMGSYAPGFFVGGGAVTLSGLMLFLIPVIERRNSNRWADDTALDHI